MSHLIQPVLPHCQPSLHPLHVEVGGEGYTVILVIDPENFVDIDPWRLKGLQVQVQVNLRFTRVPFKPL